MRNGSEGGLAAGCGAGRRIGEEEGGGGEGASATWSWGRGASAGLERRPCTQVSQREEKPALQSAVFSFIRLLSPETAAAQSLKPWILRWWFPGKPELGVGTQAGFLSPGDAVSLAGAALSRRRDSGEEAPGPRVRMPWILEADKQFPLCFPLSTANA